MAIIIVTFSHSVMLDEDVLDELGITGPDFTLEQRKQICEVAVNIWNNNEMDDMYMQDHDISDVEYEE
jgi:hypothetical protein